MSWAVIYTLDCKQVWAVERKPEDNYDKIVQRYKLPNEFIICEEVFSEIDYVVDGITKKRWSEDDAIDIFINDLQPYIKQYEFKKELKQILT